MESILSIIKSKNPEDVTQKELNAFRLLIEEALRHVGKLQAVYRGLTGINYIPNIRLR
ncbi:MAG: hypothetical protein H8D67_14750 [Deltaproteobacteria bacterium]|nr:hypothetical protein [Deltaproteobacteria bacterium]